MVDDRRDRHQGPSACCWGGLKKGLPGQGLGRSRGGFSTKIHMICDSHGNPLDFVLTQGQINDCTQSSTLLAGREAVAVIADKGYDDNKTRTTILDMNAVVVIPPRSCRKTPIEYDSHLYKARHAVEMVRLGTCGSHNPPNWHGVPSDRRGCIAPARPVGGRAETKERRWGRQTGKRKGPVFRWRPETRSG